MTEWMILAGLASLILAGMLFARAARHAADFEKCRHEKGTKYDH
ncbi:MAG: hypothetical protein AB7E05_14280 [Sphingobium sp.]